MYGPEIKNTGYFVCHIFCDQSSAFWTKLKIKLYLNRLGIKLYQGIWRIYFIIVPYVCDLQKFFLLNLSENITSSLNNYWQSIPIENKVSISYVKWKREMKLIS